MGINLYNKFNLYNLFIYQVSFLIEECGENNEHIEKLYESIKDYYELYLKDESLSHNLSTNFHLDLK